MPPLVSHGSDSAVPSKDAPAGDSFPTWHCPEHHVCLRSDGDNLLCPFGHQFPCRGGVFRFVPDEAYAVSFGIQWNKFRATQLDSYTGATISRDRLVRCCGRELWNTIAGRQVLECGCGAGRFTEILLNAGAKVTSIDLSSAVEANAGNCPPGPDHRIAQADIMRLPFAARRFDVVVCLGVVQHTPSPEAAIAALWEQVRPGGTLVFDHYAHPLAWYTSTAPLFRSWLRRLPPQGALRWSERLVRTLWPLHRAAGKRRLAQRLLSRVSPVRCYLHSLPQLNQELQYQWALLDTHDSLTDAYKHRRSRAQIRSLLSKLGAESVWCENGGNGVEARAARSGSSDRKSTTCAA